MSSRIALAAISLACCASLSHADDAPEPDATSVPAPAFVGPPAPATPSPSAPAAAPSQPTDLHPRPLGNVRQAKPAIPAGAAGGPANAPSQPAAAALWDNPLIRTGGSLLVVLVLIVALAAITKRIAGKSGTLAAALGPGGKAPAGLLEVLGRYPISRGQTLILLKIDQRVLLLAQTTSRLRGGAGGSGSLSTLCEITDPEEVASILVKANEHEGSGATAKFSALLHAFDRSHPTAEPDHTEIDLRTIQQAESGDRTELWDERAAPPVVHKFPAPLDSRSAPARIADAYAQSASPTATTSGPESFSSIRQRLHALRGEAHR